MNKKGIELSINFLVMLILGLVLLGGAIYIGLQLFSQAQSTVEQSQKSAQAELEQAQCSQIEVSCVIGNHKKIARGTISYIGLVLENTHETDDATYAITSVDLVKAYTADDQEIDMVVAESSVKPIYGDSYQPQRVAPPQSVAKLAVYFSATKQAKIGQYIYSVQVTQTVSSGAVIEQSYPVTLRVIE
jgi:hypothetical protein